MFRYETIAEELRARIGRGAYPSGRLPAERVLCSEFQVQRDTVRSALALLIENGLLLRDSTRGTYVAPWHLPGDSARPAEGERPSAAGTVLLSVQTFDDTLAPTAVFSGLSRGLGEHGVSAFWHDGSAGAGPADTAGSPYPDDDLIRKRGIGGIALWPQEPRSLDKLGPLARSLPIVVLDREAEGFAGDFAGFADFDGGREITRHLLRIGHRRIGFLGGEAWSSTVRARVAGYAAALDEAAAAEPAILEREGGRRPLHPGTIVAFLQGAAGDPLTAVVCSNDIVAGRLIQFLRAEGLRVPEDVAVTGFGNLLPPMLDAFGITTVSQPFEELGRVAGEMLLARMGGSAKDAPPRRVELPMRLIVRRSCGAGSQ